MLLVALFALNLLLPTLHGVASRALGGRDTAHDAQHCAQCQTFAQARAELAPSAVAALSPASLGDALQPQSRALAPTTPITLASGSPRSPPLRLPLA